jgi:hypothetical protein
VTIGNIVGGSVLTGLLLHHCNQAPGEAKPAGAARTPLTRAGQPRMDPDGLPTAGFSHSK